MTTTAPTEADIAYYLQSKGRGTLGSTIFVNDKPTTPDALICVFSYAGSPPDRTYDTSGNARPNIQVWVRGAINGAGAARTLAETIFNDLDGLANTDISGNRYVGIMANQSSPNHLGKDANNRMEYSVNFSVIRAR